MVATQKNAASNSKEDEDFNSIFKGNLGSLDIDNVIKASGDMKTEHAPDAIDFEDEDELAEDELPDEEPASNNLTNNGDDADDFMKDLDQEGKPPGQDEDHLDTLFGDSIGDDFADHSGFGDFDSGTHHGPLSSSVDPETSARAKEEARLLKEKDDLEQLRFQQNLLKFYYPQFKKNSILDMNTLFGSKPIKYQYHQPNQVKPLIPTKLQLEVETDQRRIFRSTLEHTNNNNDSKRIIPVGDDVFDDQISTKKVKTELDKNLILATYEWDYDSIVGDDEPIAEQKKPVITKPNTQQGLFDKLYDYEDDAIFDGNLPTKLNLDLNDPNLLFIDQPDKSTAKSQSLTIPTNEKFLLSKFNISNDKNYDLLKENYHSKVRSTIGNLNVEHSMPAIRLQSPYYKVRLSMDQIRNFHRASFKVRPGQVIQFSKLKTRKKKKDRGKEIKEIFSNTSDLTLGDTGQTILMEHTEQIPIVLSNFGMGSKLINYYRKKDEEDTTRPKLSIGETHVLGVQDKSPFWNFGFVEPGTIVPSLYNKLIRAPVFKHEMPSTDFLLIKSTGGSSNSGVQRYHLKAVSHLFVVGQLFPVVDIPGPHSRKVTTASKNRLKMIVYRVLKRSPERRLLVKDISVHFPDQNDMQNRQRLKEFMEYQRSGDDQGYWKLKEELPNDRLISPEDLTLLESMQVGQQQLDDKEFYTNEEMNDELAIWNLTKNFISATQGKAMLQINGDADGKSFSFLKTSMKGGFKSFESNGHSYNVALQQKAYDEEISRTWYDQQKRLSNPSPPTLEEVIAKNTSIPDLPNDQPKKVAETGDAPKFLKITRRVRDKNGMIQRKYEIIRDPAVIKAYIKRREKLEEDIIPEEVKVTNDEEKNQKTKKLLEEQLAKLQKNQERRNARKANKESQLGKGSGKGKSTSRRCATCGAIGHIRTNKACPMYDEGNP
jgi:transcription initiation factor TFIID subunit 1